jgi:hypothetical protein
LHSVPEIRRRFGFSKVARYLRCDALAYPSPVGHPSGFTGPSCR